MSDQYTPSLEMIRGRYCDGTVAQTGHTTDGEEFDRAMEQVWATARRFALNEAAEWVRDNGGDFVSRSIEDELLRRAES